MRESRLFLFSASFVVSTKNHTVLIASVVINSWFGRGSRSINITSFEHESNCDEKNLVPRGENIWT